jgi:hypothetical protein
VIGQLVLERPHSMGCDQTNGCIEHDLLAFELLILVNFSGVLSVVAILDLDTLDLIFVEPEVLIRDIIELSLDCKFRIHIYFNFN